MSWLSTTSGNQSQNTPDAPLNQVIIRHWLFMLQQIYKLFSTTLPRFKGTQIFYAGHEEMKSNK